MGQIRVEKNMNGIAGLCVIEPAVHGDARGYFMETYNERDMREAGIDVHFVQDNPSVISGMAAISMPYMISLSLVVYTTTNATDNFNKDSIIPTMA